MEQAVNQFTKGLQTDTNPMMQGSDTLSDCLNGTIITMNGNEVALQNDMGNRRIDNAFLPPGYEPVGMKEYGGIIYVAAYNPLTGRGQLGSFPSPERKISFKSPSAQLNLSNHIEEIGENEQKKYIIRKREQLLPLTEDVPLRAGDKFIIKTEGETNIYNYQEYLSNCFPDSTNKKWSLLVGILNSQNQFIDITNSLIRESPVYIEINEEYDGTKYKLENGEYTIINGEYSGTKYKKVDEGFYIWKDYTEESLQNTISDKELIKERMAKEINSYSYKLVSPLYIKSVLNYPYTVEYEISGEKVGEVASGRFDNSFFEDDENESRADNPFFIDDDENQNSEQSQLTPASFPKYNFEVTVTYSHIKDVLLDGIEFYNESTLIETPQEEPVEFEQEFDQITGNYITKAIYTYNNVELSGDIFNYSIVPIFKFPFEGTEEQKCYLEEFRYNGQLDLTKLNSDFIELNAWRYYNKLQSKETIFYIEYTAYPKRNSNLENIYIKINNRKFILVDSIKSQGFKTITVPWEEVIEEGKLYEAVLGYSVKGLEQSLWQAVEFNTYASGIDNQNKYEYAKITYDGESHYVLWSAFKSFALSSKYLEYAFTTKNNGNIEIPIGDVLNTEGSGWIRYPANQQFTVGEFEFISYRKYEDESWGDWSVPEQWGGNGVYPNLEYTFRFTKNSNKPNTPDVNYNIWNNIPPYNGTGFIWMSYKYIGENKWSDPVRISNDAGEIGIDDNNITFKFNRNGINNSSSNCYFVSTKLFNENFNGTEGNWISGVYNPDIHSNIFIKDFRTIQAVKIVPKINYNIQCIDNADDNISQDIMSDNNSTDYKSLISNKTLKHINTLNYNINYDSIFPKEEMPNNAQLSDIRLESLKIGNHTIELKQNAPLQNSNYTSYIMNDGETQMSNNDLLEKSGNYQNIPLETENSQEKPIIKFIQTKIAQNTGYVSMISEYNITEYIKGLTIHQDIEVTNLITSFKYFINQNGLNTINGPYFNLSHLTAGPNYWCAGTATTSIQTSTLTGNDQSNRLPSNYYSGSYELINEIIQEGHNQDVFIAEFDDADIIKGWSPTSNINLNISRPSNSDSDSPLITTDAKGEPFEDEENDGHGYSRIWLRIDKNRFIPILVYNSTYKSNLPTDYTNDILSVCEHINRYYNYNITPKSFTKYILDINNCIKTKEFDLEVQYKINYNLGTPANWTNNNKFFIWVPERKEDVLYENNIKSLSFEKEIEFLTTKVINCALLSDAGNLCLKDSTGQNFDSSYCYCKNSQLETYYKTYMPKQKVTLGEHLYLPNLINLEIPQGTSEFKVTSVVDNSPKVFVSARASMVQQANDRSYLNSHSYFFFDSLPAL